jgi:PDZ domain-containing protein
VAVSALLFVFFAALIALLPVPYVTWLPGSTFDLLVTGTEEDPIQIGEAETYPTTGELRMTTVAVTSPANQLSLPEVIAAYWLPSREVLPRDAVYSVGDTSTEINTLESQRMKASQDDAVVAALRAAQIPVQEYPMVASVQASGLSVDVLEPGDLITKVITVDHKGKEVHSVQELNEAVAEFHVGDDVVVEVLRSGKSLPVTITTKANAKQPDLPTLGASFRLGHQYVPNVRFSTQSDVGGSSGGLMMALAVYDKLTAKDLVNDRIIAGTGTIDDQGAVGSIGGVQEKIAAAVRDEATIFLLPEGNCVDVDPESTIQLIPVKNLGDAIDALLDTQDPAKSPKGC